MPQIKRTGKNLIDEALQTQKAVELIKLGARMQVLESMVSLPWERLTRIYHEVKQRSPSRGMLPFSTEWFMPWQQNAHSTLFLNIYRFMTENTKLDNRDAFIKAYRMYIEQVSDLTRPVSERIEDAMLPITRAWMLLRFVESKQIKTVACSCCSSNFLVNPMDLVSAPKCSLCRPPPRAQRRDMRQYAYVTDTMAA